MDGTTVRHAGQAEGTSGDEVRELMALAERLAREAGDLVGTAAREKTASVALTKSSVVDVVTEVDQAAEALLRERITAARPTDGILGEEEAALVGTSGLTWVLDPIDGTVNFLYGLPSFSVSVAVVAGEPDPATWTLLAGCVYAPATGATWTAGRGLGAYADGERLRLGTPPPLGQALVGTGFSYTEDGRRGQAEVLTRVLPRVRDIRRLGSAAIDLCLVAQGRLDAFYERYLNPWDMAAGALVLAEAGGVVRGLGEAPAGSAMTIGGHPDVAAALAAVIAGDDAA
ncbi:inositol monophosphatase family protein [Georgenia wangjunii]|uniref:inositol monophosphatase family protein n=1 Tax=Georgenia wangjunii TaxID=3117730 RepID=UPI002F2620F6